MSASLAGCLRRGRRVLLRAASSSGSYVPPEAESRLRSMQQHIQQLHVSGSYSEARDIAEECRTLALGHFGPDHPVSASAVNNLALMHKLLGEKGRAAVLYREAHWLYRRSVGEAHRSTATVACNLALLLRDSAVQGGASGEPADLPGAVGAADAADAEGAPDAGAALREARTLLEGAIRTREEALGARHPEVSLARSQLASVLREQGELAAASALLERAAEELDGAYFAAQAAHGDAAGVTKRCAALLAGALNSLGLLRKQQARHAEAEPLYARASDLFDAAVGAASPDAIVCRHNLAELLLAQGDRDGARKIQDDILRRVEVAQGRA